MKAPRDLARRDPWAQSVARALTPPSFAPALAIERDLSDPGVWQESIWRSQRRREAMERQLNFGPLTGKRVAVPLAMLAAGLMARDAIVSGGKGLEPAAAGAAAGARRAATVEPHQQATHVRPATATGRKVRAGAPAGAATKGNGPATSPGPAQGSASKATANANA